MHASPVTAHSRPTRPHLETHALRTHSKNNNLIACECSCIAPWPDDANTDHIISVMQQQHRHVRESNGISSGGGWVVGGRLLLLISVIKANGMCDDKIG